MKGPGLRIDIDVRRAWRCPVCGQSQRLGLDITAPRCPCVRDGVPMKLVEEKRPDRKALRPELRSMLDRIQAGEEFPRMTSLMSSEAESGPREGRPGSFGGSKPRNRPPRPERSGDNADRPPREPRLAEPPRVPTAEPTASPAPPQAAAEPPPQPSVPTDEDDFGAGLSADEPSAPQ